MRHINDKGLQIIKDSEGLRLTAYKCPAGVWTIGWGHTGHDVYEGLTIDTDRAETLLAADLDGAEAAVERACPMGISDNMFSALVSLVFNIGPGAFKTSTLLRELQAGEIARAANEFPKWNRGGGKILPGLGIRRAKERELFLTPDELTA